MHDVLELAERMGWDTSKVMPIPKETIDEIFKRNDESSDPHQATVIVELYKMVVHDWDRITKIDGWPIVSKETNEYLFRKFMDFDEKHHPTVLKSGLWMNNGFSTIADSVPIELSPLPDFHAYVGHLDYEYVEDDLVDDLKT